ncbi:glutamate-5-semialdehyde dehydrogenase [Bosea sp. BH3]|uniref:glutamate-5-semialdehyde dehydrogenase n=1 Tax=Bosea sp. BH3 TaxID=2871701 RepID=UPI0021CAF04E|nr:glutamate-5-semialdehyde dehydrogenase [Bosea sp. BH3]
MTGDSALRIIATSASEQDVGLVMQEIGQRARSAARKVALSPADQRNTALVAMAKALRSHSARILAANTQDLADGLKAGLSAAFMDRLALDEKRLAAMADAVADVAALPDPLGRVLAEWTQPNGLRFERVATPLGVIAVIFESRPNVTADAGSLCLKSGNAAILRAGSDSFRTSTEIAAAMREGLEAAGLPGDAIQLVPTRDRAAVGEILTGLGGNVDVVVPRGGKSLVARVQSEARVPVFAHLDGNCHVYVHGKANLAMARDILLNAKLRRTGVCGAAETLLVDKACAVTHLAPLVTALLEAGCAVRGDRATQAVDARVTPASEEDWSTEYLDRIIAVKVVAGLDAAIDHIERYGSHHTDAIVTASNAAAARFLAEIDSAIVVHNASTQFADGGEFGFGAEIGIATGRMHARGPVGVEQLCSFKYRVHGAGQTRP